MLKTWKHACLASLVGISLFAIINHDSLAEYQPSEGDMAPAEYRGAEPENKKLKTLVEHRVIAEFSGLEYHICRGLTGRCPDRCGSSGEFAKFKIKDYLHYAKAEDDGEDKAVNYSIHVSDFHRKPIGDKSRNDVVAGLEKGDLVVIEWKHLYGEVNEGLIAPVRPLLLLKKISAVEADRLRKQE